jgi:hypothetical protein
MSRLNIRRRVAVLAFVVGAAAVSAVVGPAAPAHALPPSLVTASSGFGSPVFAVAVATCPAGTALVGAGGRIANGNGNVVMTDVIPNVAAGTVTVWGHENGAYGGMWETLAFAICDAQITGVVRVTVQSANNSLDKNLTATCPAGTTLTGLGYELWNGNGNVFPEDVAPNAALNTGIFAATENGVYMPAWTLLGYVICGNVPAGAAPTRIANVGPVNMVNVKSQTSVCPAGTDLVGIGGELTTPNGDVVLDSLSPNATLTQATARGDEFANQNWSVVSYAVCW